MGTVYKARDPVLDRLVALKTVHPGSSPRPTPSRASSARRGPRPSSSTRTSSPSTSWAKPEETLFIAMELLEGSDLAHAMIPADRLTREQKVRIVIQICRGLDYAHKQGVFHRDVKPANVHVRPDGMVKIVDFGIARLADSNMTQTGLVLGTPSYMAPEVLIGGARRPPGRHVGGRGHPLRAPRGAPALRGPDHHEPRLPDRPRAAAALRRRACAFLRPWWSW